MQFRIIKTNEKQKISAEKSYKKEPNYLKNYNNK